MKKIKYGNKKFEQENRELENLKEGDEITEAVLDTMNDDYLSYISHLVKNTKTPHKKAPPKVNENPSSDEQPPQNFPTHPQPHPELSHHSQVQTKARRHSEASAKISMLQRESEFKKVTKGKNESMRVSPRGRGETQPPAAPKSKKRKIEYIHNESVLKNEQKTMQLSRNTVQQHSKIRDDHYDFDRDASKKSRVTHKSREKYYVTSQNCDDTDHEPPSIEIPLKRQSRQSRKEEKGHQNFIDNINEYITTLQENESVNLDHHRKDTEDDRLFRKISKKKHKMEDEDQDIQEILKQNMKLSKRVKAYEEKISELDEDINSVVTQCKNKQKTYKSKINYLLRGLIQAFMKIDAQQAEISTLKDLHRSYGQKVKQIQNKYDDDDVLEDIREQIFKNLAPKRHSSQIRTKHKKVLESTLPKYDQDRRFW